MQPTPRTNIHDYLDLVKQEFPDSFRQAFEKAKKSQESDLVHIVL